MIKETISEHKPIFILMIITLTLLLIFTVIYFVMPVNAEEKETSYATEEMYTQTVKESETKKDNNTLNIDSNNATSQETEETPTDTQENILAEIRDTLYNINNANHIYRRVSRLCSSFTINVEREYVRHDNSKCNINRLFTVYSNGVFNVCNTLIHIMGDYEALALRSRYY